MTAVAPVADKLFTGACDFISAASMPDHFPPGKLPEIAFWGRSNAGKSSLINALTDRKTLARTSKTPGRTQQIIFFNLADRLMLADLPGYGHAKAPREERDRWNELIHHYLQSRPQLNLVCRMLDARHGLMTNDLEMMQRLDRAAATYQIVLTKIDLVKAPDRVVRERQTKAILERHPAARSEVMGVSSEKRAGIDELRHLLTGFAGKKPL
jgi:GTP-binding protein